MTDTAVGLFHAFLVIVSLNWVGYVLSQYASSTRFAQVKLIWVLFAPALIGAPIQTDDVFTKTLCMSAVFAAAAVSTMALVQPFRLSTHIVAALIVAHSTAAIIDADTKTELIVAAVIHGISALGAIVCSTVVT